jgi:hypothetical protein
MRKSLEKRGLWRGAGFACIIDIANVTTIRDLLGILSHEYGHFVTLTPTLAALSDLMGPEKVIDALSEPSEAIKRGDPPEPVTTDIRILRQDHDARFIRVCLHLERRAARLGRPIIAVDPVAYGWPPLWQWKRALADEPTMLVSLSLSAIASMKPPTSYQDFSTTAIAEAETSFLQRKDTDDANQ